MRIPPGEEGCLTKISTIRTITRHGNSKTNPSGIEIDELPFNLIRRLKKANRDTSLPFSWETSSRDARAGADGRRLTIRRKTFMVAENDRWTDD
jgi:hypothetical protein